MFFSLLAGSVIKDNPLSNINSYAKATNPEKSLVPTLCLCPFPWPIFTLLSSLQEQDYTSRLNEDDPDRGADYYPHGHFPTRQVTD